MVKNYSENINVKSSCWNFLSFQKDIRVVCGSTLLYRIERTFNEVKK
jgi:hypothetical protein